MKVDRYNKLQRGEAMDEENDKIIAALTLKLAGAEADLYSAAMDLQAAKALLTRVDYRMTTELRNDIAAFLTPPPSSEAGI